VPAASPAKELRRFKPYPAYKDSGIEWLGEIPAHWEVAPVYARYEVALGKMLDAKRVTGKFSGGYLRNVDVQWNAVNTEGLPEMDFAPWERERYLLRPGDLLVCEGGEVGRTAIWRGEVDECFYQKAIHRVRAHSKEESPRFFYYLMYTLAKRGVFVAGGNPNTIDHLTAVQLRHYRLPFSPPPEQRAIAAFLDRETTRIDALVAKKERLIELLQEKRTALITGAVTKGLDPNASTKKSGVEWLGEIPAHWKVKRLVHLSDPSVPIVYGILLPGPRLSDGVPYIGAGDIPGHLGLAELPRTTEEIAAQYPRSRIRAGEIVYAIRGSFGAVEVVPSELDGVNLSRDAARVAPRQSIVAQWLCWALRSETSQRQFGFYELGATITGVNIRDLKRILIPCPPSGEQSAIAAYLNRETAKLDALIAKVREAIDRLKELRISLISAAVTGKIDVREETA
jgi:type I restriction enzyme S subunit